MPAPVKLKTKTEYGAAETAVSLAIPIIRKSKANTWAEFIELARAEDINAITAVQAYDLSAEQMELLEANQRYVNLVQISPAVTPSFCDTCGTINLVSGTASSKCINTRGCAGTMTKPTGATQVK